MKMILRQFLESGEDRRSEITQAIDAYHFSKSRVIANFANSTPMMIGSFSLGDESYTIMSKKYILLVFSFLNLISVNAQNKNDEIVKIDSIDLAVPNVAHCLSIWPNQNIIEKNEVKVPTGAVKFAETTYKSWMQKSLDPDIQPPDGTKTYFIRDEFRETDVIRQRWNSRKMSFELSQIAIGFCLKVTPDMENSIIDAYDKKLDLAKNIFRLVFAKNGIYIDNQGNRTPIENFNEKIINRSFDLENLRKCEDKNGKSHLMHFRKEYPIVSSAEFWYDNVDWWTDGNSVVIYFWKIEGNMIPMGPRDQNSFWF